MNQQKLDKLSLPRFENLNGLRFIGAFSVFLFHAFFLGNEVWGDFYTSEFFKLILPVIRKGHHGVGLFFVLSGFLITYLLLHEAKVKERINVGGFFMRRMLRIWPVYFVVICFGFLIFPHLTYGIQTSNSLLHYSLFLSNFEEIWNGWRDSVNFLTITWSVSIEEQFYISWVVLMLLLPPFRKGKWFLGYFTALMIINLAFRFWYVDHPRTIYYGTFSVISDLALGGYMSYLCFHFDFNKKVKALSKWKTIAIYAVGILIILGSRTFFPGSLIALERIFTGLFFAFIIYEQAFSPHSFFKADKLPGFYRMGEMNYGIYMYHCIVIYYVQMIFQDLGWSSLTYFVLYILLSFALTMAVSYLSYQFMERPLLRLKKYFR